MLADELPRERAGVVELPRERGHPRPRLPVVDRLHLLHDQGNQPLEPRAAGRVERRDRHQLVHLPGVGDDVVGVAQVVVIRAQHLVDPGGQPGVARRRPRERVTGHAGAAASVPPQGAVGGGE